MRIAQLTLAAADPAAQAEFWGGRLGLGVREADGIVEVLLRRSAIRFEPAAEGTDPRYHFAFNIPPGTIDEAASWLGDRHELLEFHGILMSRRARRSSGETAELLPCTSSTPAATSSS
jgi:hypothetical protein